MVVVNTKLVNEFNKLAINNRIDPFFEADIEQFFDDDHQFSLNIKRSREYVSLYSSKHVEIRQQFFNTLPESKQILLFKKKLAAVGITDWVEESVQKPLDSIKTVTDVGKGRTIYKMTLEDNRSFVVKEKTNNLQQKFNKLSKLFNISASDSHFIKVSDTFWEVAPFLDEDEVFHFKKDHLFDLYPKAAAFGDFIGLGDRHFENYISKHDQLIAIDVSHLMENENEHWTKKYISGGLYECCLLQYFISDKKQFEHYLDRFFLEYSKTTDQLIDSMDKLNSNSEYFEDLKKIKNKWKSSKQFIHHMQHIYFQGLCVMLDRLPYKKVLQQLVENKISLDNHPELRMYQLSDSDRISTFFRIEEESLNLFDEIEKLALDHLGVTKKYFSDYQQTTSKIRQTLNPRRGTLLFV